MSPTPGQPAAWWKKLAWLILIWGLSVAALAVVAYVLRWLMKLAGLSV